MHFLGSRRTVEVPYVGALVNGGLRRFTVESVNAVRGRPVANLAPGWRLTRVESQEPLRASPADVTLEGVATHTLYTTAEQRRALDEQAAPPHRRQRAVLIPLSKSEAWWRMAQDERQQLFAPRGSGARPGGHIGIGMRYLERFPRRLYHARFLPTSEWDFLTFFELDDDDVETFRRMLSELRDPERNPEWRFVEREVEIWLRPA